MTQIKRFSGHVRHIGTLNCGLCTFMFIYNKRHLIFRSFPLSLLFSVIPHLIRHFKVHLFIRHVFVRIWSLNCLFFNFISTGSTTTRCGATIWQSLFCVHFVKLQNDSLKKTQNKLKCWNWEWLRMVAIPPVYVWVLIWFFQFIVCLFLPIPNNDKHRSAVAPCPNWSHHNNP